MPNQDPIELTPRERFILTYYRTAELASYDRRWLYDGVTVVASLACLLYSFVGPDPAFSFVAYGLVVTRLLYLVMEGRKWGADFRSIFSKYDAKIKELTDALARKSEKTDGV